MQRFFNFTNDYIDENNPLNTTSIVDYAGENSVMIIPFDVDEDGRMDVIVQTGGNKFGLHLIYNNMIYDSYYIKAMMLSQEYDNPLNLDQYGAITTGATFRYLITSVDDVKSVRVASQ